jgi:uncharacterized protein YjbI with pentapeptide repeats
MSGTKLAGTTFSDSSFNQTDLTGADLRGANFTLDQMSEADLSGANAAGANFTLTQMSQSDLQDADLRLTSFLGADMSAANLSRSIGTGSNMSLANLQSAQANDTDLNGAQLLGTNLNGANLRASELQGSNLGAAQLQQADLTAVDGRQADLTAADMTGATANDAQLDGAMLIGTNANGAQMERADLHDSTAIGVQMNQADLRKADLSGAVMVSASLTGANLTRAKLEGTDLRNADLSGADLRGASLGGANLEGANLEGAQIDSAQARQLERLGIDTSGAVVTDRDDEGARASWDVDLAPDMALASNRPGTPEMSQLAPSGANARYVGNFDCAPASMAMMLRAAGPDAALAVGDQLVRAGDLSDADLIKALGKIGGTTLPDAARGDPGGTDLNGAAEMAWSMGQPVSVTEVRGGDLRPQDPAFDQEWMDRQLAAGKSVLANGRHEEGTESFDHFVAVVGKSGKGDYVVNDPWTGKQAEWSGKELQSFLAGNSQYGGAMMAIGGDKGYQVPAWQAPQPSPFGPQGPQGPQAGPQPSPSTPASPTPTPRSNPDPTPRPATPAPAPGVPIVRPLSAPISTPVRPIRPATLPKPETAPFRPLTAAQTAARLALQARQPIAV